MDPPPQAHIGVGHDPEYTMPVWAGQLTVAMRTERERSVRSCDGRTGRVGAHEGCLRPVTALPPSPVTP